MGPCYKPAATIAVISAEIMNVIDSNHLEHDERPKTAAQFSASCSGIAAGHDAILAGVAELVDALDLGSSDESCGGSSPSARTRRSRLRMTNFGSYSEGASAPKGSGSPNHWRKAIQPRADQIENVPAFGRT
jgi:hypothetical protein